MFFVCLFSKKIIACIRFDVRFILHIYHYPYSEVWLNLYSFRKIIDKIIYTTYVKQNSFFTLNEEEIHHESSK